MLLNLSEQTIKDLKNLPGVFTIGRKDDKTIYVYIEDEQYRENIPRTVESNDVEIKVTGKPYAASVLYLNIINYAE